MSSFNMKLKFAQSARKHRIGKAHALHVIRTVDPLTQPGDDGTTEYEWLGPDDREQELHIIGLGITDHKTGEPIILIIHVFPTALKGRSQ